MTKQDLIIRLQKLANKHGYRIHDLIQTEDTRVRGDLLVDKLINAWNTNNPVVFNEAINQVNERIGTRSAVPAVQ